MHQRQSQGGPLKNKPEGHYKMEGIGGPKNWNRIAPSPATVIYINL